MRVESRSKTKQRNSGKAIGALFGLGMFFGSFLILWSNEGRVNFGEVAQDSIAIEAANIDPAKEGKFVAAHGDLLTNETLGDPQFIGPNEYVQLNRVVEMYAWHEEEHTDSEDDTHYEYETVWTASPENSRTFYDTSYHNPLMPFNQQTFTVTNAWISAYGIDPRSVEYPEPDLLNLQNEMILVDAIEYGDVVNNGEYLYVGYDTLESPEIGDVRISYTAVPQTQNVTIFGAVSGEQILPYRVQEDDSLYRVFFSSRESAIEQMQEEYTIALWGTRFGGFFMMWCGLFLIINPITILVSFIPFLQRAGSWAIIAATFPIAAIISIVVVAVAFLAHNPYVLAGLICLSVFAIGGIVAGVLLLERRRKEAAHSV